MAKFTINDTIPCWVTFSYEVEANSEQEALQKYREDDAGPCFHTEIGHNVEGVDNVIEIEKA